MHRLLRRQLDRHAGGADSVPAEWRAFVAAVDEAYRQSDVDRGMLERSLELSSAELLQSSSEMRAVFQALPDAFLRLAADGKVLEIKGIDPAAFFLEAGDLVGKPVAALPQPEMALALDRARAQVSEKRALVSTEYIVEQAGGQRCFEARLLPLLEDQVMVIVRDITERQAFESRLAEQAVKLANSNSELEQFAYVASHDLQEPLRTIQSYLQLMQRRLGDRLDGDVAEFMRFVVDGAQRMREMITDLLMYARVSSRAKPFEPTPLGDVVREVKGVLGAVLEATGGEVVCDDLPVVRCDRVQMAQLLQNLIGNALKFHGETKPRVEISARRTEEGWQLAVKDNGIGIEPRHLDRIFVIFQRLHAPQEYPGTGIGLAVCRKIVERHKGRIWAESGPNQGTTVHFTLPAA